MLGVIMTVVLSLLFSAFFSGMEIAFTTSNKLKLEIDKKSSSTFNNIATIFLKNPGQYITTILVGNNIALVIFTLFMSKITAAIMHSWGIQMSELTMLLDTIISTIIIIFTAEFTPKTIVRLNPNFYLKIFVIPVYICYLLLYPIAKITTWISFFILRICGLKVNKDSKLKGFDRLDLELLLEEAVENEGDQESDQEIKLFQNALDFSDIKVRECMIPRIDMEAVESNSTILELSQRFVVTQYSRILIYEGSIDNIIGYVNGKSLFRKPTAIKDVMRQVSYVTESMSVQKLLEDFIRTRKSIAVVIDEFGGTAGLISMEDILEEIFGDIEDEYDSKDGVEKILSDGSFLLNSRLEVDYINEQYNLNIPESDEYDTLAGYVIFNYEGIPPQGAEILIDNKKITIVKTSASKIELVKLTVIQ